MDIFHLKIVFDGVNAHCEKIYTNVSPPIVGPLKGIYQILKLLEISK